MCTKYLKAKQPSKLEKKYGEKDTYVHTTIATSWKNATKLIQRTDKRTQNQVETNLSYKPKKIKKFEI